MSVARVSGAFVGGLWGRSALKASEVRSESFQGPVPPTLLPGWKPQPVVRVVPEAPRRLPNQKRSEAAKRGARTRLATQPKEVRSQAARRHMLAYCAKLTPEQRRARSAKGLAAMQAAKSPEMLHLFARKAGAASAAVPPEERRRRGRAGAATRKLLGTDQAALAAAREANRKRWNALTLEQRKERMAELVRQRWAKHRKERA